MGVFADPQPCIHGGHHAVYDSCVPEGLTFKGADKYQAAVDLWITSRYHTKVMPGSGQFGIGCGCYGPQTLQDDPIVMWRDEHGTQEIDRDSGAWLPEVLAEIVAIVDAESPPWPTRHPGEVHDG